MKLSDGAAPTIKCRLGLRIAPAGETKVRGFGDLIRILATPQRILKGT